MQSLYGYAQQQKLAVLSLFPQQQMLSFAERVVVPIMHLLLLGLLRLRWVLQLPLPSMAAANGQCMFIERNFYRHHQLHQQVKSSLVEDIAIMRYTKQQQARGAVRSGNGNIGCRMYTNYTEAVSGFTKNLIAGFGGSYTGLLLYLLLVVVAPVVLAVLVPGASLLLLLFALVECLLLASLMQTNLFKNCSCFSPGCGHYYKSDWPALRVLQTKTIHGKAEHSTNKPAPAALAQPLGAAAGFLAPDGRCGLSGSADRQAAGAGRAKFCRPYALSPAAGGLYAVPLPPPEKQKILGTAGAVATLGYAVEVLGVNTGFPFGDYTYGSALGVKLFATPLLIGLNWVVLIYTFSSVVNVLLSKSSKWLQAAASATWLMLFDVLVEPVAIALDFWQWENVTVPLENYLAWWALSLIFSVMMMQLNKVNPVVWWVLVCQLFFFSCLRIVLIFLE